MPVGSEAEANNAESVLNRGRNLSSDYLIAPILTRQYSPGPLSEPSPSRQSSCRRSYTGKMVVRKRLGRPLFALFNSRGHVARDPPRRAAIPSIPCNSLLAPFPIALQKMAWHTKLGSAGGGLVDPVAVAG